MPGVARMTLDKLLPVAGEALDLGIPALALFPAIELSLKTADGVEATNPAGLIPRIVRELKKRFPQLGLMTDVALDPYTSHGQDGVIDESGYILNDETIAILREQALVQARGGRRHRRSVRHDGRSSRRHPRRTRLEAVHPYTDHGVLGEVRIELLRAFS